MDHVSAQAADISHIKPNTNTDDGNKPVSETRSEKSPTIPPRKGASPILSKPSIQYGLNVYDDDFARDVHHSIKD
ncbi:hypothetical protein Bhyg_01603 [Pseudolycoriella hygida]|uniref:Uncharacterized protein n=1 Tax=Pseudolycoriella hygida TaxID=35572 RepID=A0A9Q0NAJ9_9DIPT|nr:hypothetical protein Bhyg_01603 [Pseudolycoriella hygida]